MAFDTESLTIPNFYDFTEIQFLDYIDSEVRTHSIDRDASREIKQAMEPAVFKQIQDLIAAGVLENLSRLRILIQVYGFTRTGIMFNPVYLGAEKNIENSELESRIQSFITRDPSTYSFDDFAIMLGYITLLIKRTTDF